MVTLYSLAWEDYKKSADYQRAVASMKNKHMNQPYIDNILRGAFDAGWGVIKTIKKGL